MPAPPTANTPNVMALPSGFVPPKPPVLIKSRPEPAPLPKSPLGPLGDVAVELGLHLLSGNFLSGNQPRTFSATTHDLLTGDEVPVLSGNKVRLEDSNPASLASGNKLEIRKSAGGDLLNSPFSFMSGNKLEIRIINSGNGSGNNNRDSWNYAAPGGEDCRPGAPLPRRPGGCPANAT